LCLQVLSRHERLGVPLPQRTALQLPQLLLTAPGGCSSMKLHQSILEAAADLQLHSAQAASRDPYAAATVSGTGNSDSSGGVQQLDSVGAFHNSSSSSRQKGDNAAAGSAPAAVAEAASSSNSAGVLDTRGSPHTGGSKVHSELLQHVCEVRSELHRQSVPAGGMQLDEVEELAACGPVGGGKAAYVMAKLLAAAAWTELGLAYDCSANRSWKSSSSSKMGGSSGGRRMKHVLLSSGCFQPSQHTVMQLLGGADVLLPVAEQQQQQGAAGSRSTAAGAGGSRRYNTIVGWVPDLGHDVYQELELV
jgi:hypothetical protein